MDTAVESRARSPFSPSHTAVDFVKSRTESISSEIEIPYEGMQKLLRPEYSESAPPPIPADIEYWYGDRGELIWVETDASGGSESETEVETDHHRVETDASGGSESETETDHHRVAIGGLPLVDCLPIFAFENFLIERKERRERRKRLMEQEKPQVTSQLKTGNKSKKGKWFCVFKYYCEICNKDGDHSAAFCPNNKDEFGRPLKECKICLKGCHPPAECPYLNFVPKDAKVGPGGIRVCRCCGEDDGDGHSEDDYWIACAVYNRCDNCGAFCDHPTKDCPKPKNN